MGAGHSGGERRHPQGGAYGRLGRGKNMAAEAVSLGGTRDGGSLADAGREITQMMCNSTAVGALGLGERN